MSYRLGLTGGIGMGKTTSAAMFAARGVPVWDADAAVHRLYSPGGGAVGPVGALFPAAVVAGGIDRAILRQLLAQAPDRLADLEAVVHPLVAADRAAFAAAHKGAAVILFDIPLLFETGAERQLDGVAVASAPPAVQRARVLSRPGMDTQTLDLILSRQLDDETRRARAGWIIPTASLVEAEAAVDAILRDIAKGMSHA